MAAVARALTGYTLNWTTRAIYMEPNRYDSASKTFLGAPRGNAGYSR